VRYLKFSENIFFGLFVGFPIPVFRIFFIFPKDKSVFVSAFWDYGKNLILSPKNTTWLRFSPEAYLFDKPYYLSFF
jgi:hypothetical protein